MNILNITFAQSKVNSPDFLNFLTTPENGAGVNQEKYWMINTNVFDRFANPDFETQKFAHLLYICVTKGFSQLMIMK
jgi:hypothetical protein